MIKNVKTFKPCNTVNMWEKRRGYVSFNHIVKTWNLKVNGWIEVKRNNRFKWTSNEKGSLYIVETVHSFYIIKFYGSIKIAKLESITSFMLYLSAMISKYLEKSYSIILFSEHGTYIKFYAISISYDIKIRPEHSYSIILFSEHGTHIKFYVISISYDIKIRLKHSYSIISFSGHYSSCNIGYFGEFTKPISIHF